MIKHRALPRRLPRALPCSEDYFFFWCNELGKLSWPGWHSQQPGFGEVEALSHC